MTNTAIGLLTAAAVLVGTAASPSPNPPGAGDSSPQDYQGAWWVVVAVAVVVVIIAAGLLYVRRSHRTDPRRAGSPEYDEHSQRRDRHRSR